MGGESFAHVLVALIFLIYQVVCGCDVVVTVGFHASNCILLLKVEVLNEFAQ
jgi:hypothetical protein